MRRAERRARRSVFQERRGQPRGEDWVVWEELKRISVGRVLGLDEDGSAAEGDGEEG